MSEPFHIPHSPWCERANEHIAELEAALRKLAYHALGLDASTREVDALVEWSLGMREETDDA